MTHYEEHPLMPPSHLSEGESPEEGECVIMQVRFSVFSPSRRVDVTCGDSALIELVQRANSRNTWSRMNSTLDNRGRNRPEN